MDRTIGQMVETFLRDGLRVGDSMAGAVEVEAGAQHRRRARGPEHQAQNV